MQQWCLEVRGHTTDLGPECLIGDMPDITGAYLEHELVDISDLGRALNKETFMFPLSITVPGHSHLCDSLMKQALWSLPFYPQYLRSARTLCGFLRNRTYRSALMVYLRELGHYEEARTLMAFSASFAKWRFGTKNCVCVVAQGVRRLAPGLVSRLGQVFPQRLQGGRPGHHRRAVLAVELCGRRYLHLR